MPTRTGPPDCWRVVSRRRWRCGRCSGCVGRSVRYPVLVLASAVSSGARQRTLESLAQQSIHVDVRTTAEGLASLGSESVALVLAGTVLDATACERAAWFLASHAEVPCVTGAVRGAALPPDRLASALQFLVMRTSVARELLSDTDVLTAATAAALLAGSRRATGRGAAWLSEPPISVAVDAPVLVRDMDALRGALVPLGLDDAALFDTAASGVPVAPLQSLVPVTAPAIEVQRVPTTGMRILALLQGFPMGGYTAFNAELLPRLVAAGHAVTTCTTELFQSDWRQAQVREVAPDIHHAHAVVPPTAVPAYVDWLIESRGIDVVLLSHSFLGAHLLPYLRARHPTVAFVDYVHTDWFEQAMYGSYASLSATFASQLDAQLATSDALSSQLVRHGCDAAAVRTAHIGIDTAAWQHDGPRLEPVRRALGATPDTVVLLFSGRIAPEKRPHLAVAVLAQLRAEGRDVLLVFAGGGQLLQATHARAEQLGVASHCRFLGELDEPTLRHVYAASDVFLAPSEIEGISRSLYEAMAMGCVPVVSDVGGQRELVVPGTGSLVDASGREAAPYVAAVRPWLDRRAREQAAAAARAHIVAHFDTRCTVERVCAALQLGMARRAQRQEQLPAAMAGQLAVLSLEIIRRHLLAVAARQ